MTTDDEATRKARADQLRQAIARKRAPPADTAEDAAPETEPPSSPLEYIDRKMRELDRKRKAD